MHLIRAVLGFQVDPVVSRGDHNSIAVDSTGVVHISYLDSLGRMYANAGSWQNRNC